MNSMEIRGEEGEEERRREEEERGGGGSSPLPVIPAPPLHREILMCPASLFSTRKLTYSSTFF